MVEKLLRTIFCKQMFLYPRIRKEVKAALDEPKDFRVVESNIEMTPKMQAIQDILIDLLVTCLDEIKV